VKEATVRALFDALKARNVSKNADWLQASCLFAPWKHKGTDANPSFGVWLHPQKRSYFHCFSCGSSGGLEDLVNELRLLAHGQDLGWDLALAYKLLDEEKTGGYLPAPEWTETDAQTTAPAEKPWPETWLASFMPWWKSQRASFYLTETRRLTTEALTHFEVRYDTFRDCVSFPIRNAQGALVGLRGRYISPKGDLRFHDYDCEGVRNKRLWINAHALDRDQPIVVCEGTIDVPSVWPYYRNVTSALSTGVSAETVKMLLYFPTVVAFMDNDQGGEQGFKKIVKALGGQVPIKRVTYPDQAGKDPNSLTCNQLQFCLASAGLKSSAQSPGTQV
jgi:hypothetical protein